MEENPYKSPEAEDEKAARGSIFKAILHFLFGDASPSAILLTLLALITVGGFFLIMFAG